MILFPKAVELFELLRCSTTRIWLGNHGSESPKPIKVYSTVPYMVELKATLDKKKITEQTHGAITKKT